MTVIRLLSQPFWQQLGLTLIHFLWQGLLVALLVAAAVQFFRLGHGRNRYWAYLTAFALMAACPPVTFLVIGRPVQTGDVSPNTSAVMTTVVEREYPAVSTTPAQPGMDARAQAAQAAAPPGANRLQDWLPWAVGFWMAGVTVLSLRLLLGYIGIRRWQRQIQPLPQRLAERVTRLGQRLGMPQFSRVFLCPALSEATAIGYLRPMVLLPAAMLTRMDPAMIEAVIAHELAHIRRLDLWVNLAQRIVETLLFYHPAVWWLSNRLRIEREFCCDEMAVVATGERLTYASALEAAQRGRLAAAQPQLAVALGQGKGSTLRRVRHILGLPPAPADSRFWLAGAIAVTVLAIVAMPAISLLTQQAEAKTTEANDSLLDLFQAAETGDIERVKTLIAAGADVTVQDREGKAALHYAAGQGHLEIVRRLIDHGADVNAGAQAGWTPLLATTAYKGHAEIVDLLLKNRARVNDADTAGYTPLHYAIWADDEETVKTLIAHGADVNKTPEGDYSPLAYAIWQWHTGNVKTLMDAGADINARDDNGWTPLYWAVDEGAPEIIELFLEAGVEMPAIHRAVLEGDLERVKRLVEDGVVVDARDKAGWPLTLWALSAGQVEILDYLLSQGASVTNATDGGLTLLHKASQKGLSDVVKRLLAGGAEVNARTKDGKTPLWLAARRGDKEVCRLLIAGGADVNAALNSGRTVLGDATVGGHEEVVKLLLANGADVNLNPNDYGVPLQAAVRYGHPALVDILIAAGANVNANTRYGTALHMASRGMMGKARSPDEATIGLIVKKLLEHGADVNTKDKQRGCTPLHAAAEAGRLEAARLLIAAGADLNAKDNQGRTPLSYAEDRYECRKVAELLRAHGASEETPAASGDQTPAKSLHEAAAGGDIERMEALLASGADVNGRQEKTGRTPLHEAAEQGHREVAELLIAKGAHVNARTTDKGWTPLTCAVNERHAEVAKLLLDHGAQVDANDTWGYTPLCYAVWNEDEALVRTLIAAGADAGKRFSDENPYTPFFEAVWMDNADLTKPLIDAGANVNDRDGKGWTPLHWAVYYGSVETARLFIGKSVTLPAFHRAVLAGDMEKVRQLIEDDVDVDTPDHLGWTPAFWAVSTGRRAICEYLLDRGANPTKKIDDGCSLLHQASRAGYADLVKRLIAMGAEVNAIYGNRRSPRSALGEAALNGHHDVVELLVAHGADVNLHAGDRGPAIYAAAWTGQASLVDLFLAHGADVNIKAPNGPAVLHMAVDCRPYVDEDACAEVVARLIAAGADVNAREPRHGDTPLHIAIRKGHTQAAKLLIQAGADPGARNKDDKTPMDLAREQGLTSTI